MLYDKRSLDNISENVLESRGVKRKRERSTAAKKRRKTNAKRKQVSKNEKTKAPDVNSCLKELENDELCVTLYVPEMLKICSNIENDLLADPNYFDNQPNLSPQFRKRLFNWIYGVFRKYGLTQDTLFLSVNLFDRYLSKVEVHRSNLQKVGSCAFWMASKYHDISAMSASMLEELSDGAFKVAELLETETCMATTLEFRLFTPTCLTFLNRYLINVRNEKKYKLIQLASDYFAECLLLNVSFVGILPSLHAAISFYFAIYLCCANRWDDELQALTGYKSSQLYKYGHKIYETSFLQKGTPKNSCQIQKIRLRNNKLKSFISDKKIIDAMERLHGIQTADDNDENDENQV